MPTFDCTFVTSAGGLARDTIAGANEAEVVRHIRRLGGTPTRVQPASADGAAERRGLPRFRTEPALSKRELADLTGELAVMLGAGQDLDSAFRFFIETRSRARVRSVVERVRETVRDGGLLSAAMEQQPKSFPPLYVGLIRAGEASGTVVATLESLATLLERQRGLASTVQSALIYPALLVVAAIGSIAFLLTQVLPQFIPLFEQNGVALPRSTAIMIATGDFLSAYGLYGIIAGLALALALARLLRHPGPRLLADRLLLAVPIVGSLAREVLAARFSRTLGTLLLNRVPLTTSLGIVITTLGNRAGIAAVEVAAEAAKTGAGLAGPLRATRTFPTRTVHLLHLGETNGRLGEMALRAADIHEESTRLAVQRLVSLMVPAIVIVMGAIVAAVVSSVLSAMLSLNDLAR